MRRIGLVDLDTSHSRVWLPIINQTDDLRVTAVWDGGEVHPPGYAERFAHEHGVEQACTSLDELVASVDAGMIMGQNWDLHIERARPFLEAGKPIFIDKPVVGRLRDIKTLLALAEQSGTPVMGGSALRFAEDVVALRTRCQELGHLSSAVASGPGDFFNYGIHVVEMVAGFFGAVVEGVRYLGGSGSELLLLEQGQSPPVVVQLSAPAREFFFMVTTEQGIQVADLAAGGTAYEHVYAALIRQFSGMLHTGEPPVSLADALQAIAVCLAAAEARRRDRRVTLDDLPVDAGFDGHAFTADYRRAKYGAIKS